MAAREESREKLEALPHPRLRSGAEQTQEQIGNELSASVNTARTHQERVEARKQTLDAHRAQRRAEAAEQDRRSGDRLRIVCDRAGRVRRPRRDPLAPDEANAAVPK